MGNSELLKQLTKGKNLISIAAESGVDVSIISKIICGKCSTTERTAKLLNQYFETSSFMPEKYNQNTGVIETYHNIYDFKDCLFGIDDLVLYPDKQCVGVVKQIKGSNTGGFVYRCKKLEWCRADQFKGQGKYYRILDTFNETELQHIQKKDVAHLEKVYLENKNYKYTDEEEEKDENVSVMQDVLDKLEPVYVESIEEIKEKEEEEGNVFEEPTVECVEPVHIENNVQDAIKQYSEQEKIDTLKNIIKSLLEFI